VEQLNLKNREAEEKTISNKIFSGDDRKLIDTDNERLAVTQECCLFAN